MDKRARHSEEADIHLLLGGHKVPYNNNGVVVKYFSADGEENDNHTTRFPEMCVAGKPLDDSYTAITDQMGFALRCDLGTNYLVKDCGDLFERLVGDGKIKKGCSYKTVYDGNEERYNLAIKKECIN